MIRFLRSRLGGDRGVAMPLVIGITSVLMILITTAVVTSVNGIRQSSTTANWSGALGAAYAGVEEYQSRLTVDPSYWTWGDPASPFVTASSSTVKKPAQANPAFGLGSAGSWSTVPGSSERAEFRYQVDNSRYASAGVLRLQSTGRVGGEIRTILADLKQDGFINYLYFTDFEIQDPVYSNKSTTECRTYAWAWSNRTKTRKDACGTISFGGNDILEGPVHSNDTMLICKATFKQQVTTGYKRTTAGNLYSSDGCGNGQSPSFEKSKPTSTDLLPVPESNTAMKKETRADLKDSDVPRPGCLYTGPTKITLLADGFVTVRSPFTKATQVTGDPARGAVANAQCGNIANIQSAEGDTFKLPENNLIYVQNVPVDSTRNPNYSVSNSAQDKACTVRYGSNNRNYASNGIGYPIDQNEDVPFSDSEKMSYGCRNGDVFIEGTIRGNTTVAAENYIYITGDIRRQVPSEDILGLVGDNAVWVYNPMDGNTPMKDNNQKGRTIEAAILSVNHTFGVQNHDLGSRNRGELRVTGSIAQRFRGPVGMGTSDGTITTGYKKVYKYDEALLKKAPPKFLNPVTTSYGVTTWIEVDRAVNSDGSAR